MRKVYAKSLQGSEGLSGTMRKYPSALAEATFGNQRRRGKKTIWLYVVDFISSRKRDQAWIQRDVA